MAVHLMELRRGKLNVACEDRHGLGAVMYRDLLLLQLRLLRLWLLLAYRLSSWLFVKSWIHENLAAQNVLLTKPSMRTLPLLRLDYFLRLKLPKDCPVTVVFVLVQFVFQQHIRGLSS